MSDSNFEQQALERRAARARARLQKDLAQLEDRGQRFFTTARHAARTAAIVGLGLTGFGAMALIRALARRSGDPRRQAGHVPLLLGLAVPLAMAGLALVARRLSGLVPASRRLLLPQGPANSPRVGQVATHRLHT
jgi:hypothetical protein